MPRVSIDYSKTVIYRIVCKDPTIKDCYVGSTTDFKSRKKSHKSNCNNIYNTGYAPNIYMFICNNGGWNNWDMIEIEKYNAIDKLDADKRERYWLEFYQATLNKCIPSRARKEYREDNKDKIIEYTKIYRDENREEINRKALERYYRNKEQRLMGLEDKCVI